MTRIWADLREAADDDVTAVREAAVHAGASAIVDDDAARLADLPPSVTRVYAGADTRSWSTWTESVPPRRHNADQMLLPVSTRDELDRLAAYGDEFVANVEVVDQRTLDVACASAVSRPRTVVSFADPTKIPLEIVIAAADRSTGELICRVADPEEAAIVLGVLEKGSEGVLYPAREPGDVSGMHSALSSGHPPLHLCTLSVEQIKHIGLGDRVCVDTCSHFELDEGILVGSFANGYVLCCSETHPLPYMPTRPFRVNAGALHSYVLRAGNRTGYLSELRSGMSVLAVQADGTARVVMVGRAKLERRPLMQIDAVAGNGTRVCITVQDDWHVRVLGPGGRVLNVTALGPGSEVLGYLVDDSRHVGYPVDEFCVEQ